MSSEYTEHTRILIQFTALEYLDERTDGDVGNAVDVDEDKLHANASRDLVCLVSSVSDRRA